MAQRISRTTKADCLDCYTTLYFETLPAIGQVIICPICESALEVILRDPLVLNWVVDGEFYEGYEEVERWVYAPDDHVDYTKTGEVADLGWNDYLDEERSESDPDDVASEVSLEQ